MVNSFLSIPKKGIFVVFLLLVKTKSTTSILKKRPLAPSNSADSPMIVPKLGPEPTSSPVDLQPPPSVQSTMSPKPSAIQRIQSFFRNTPRKLVFYLSHKALMFVSVISASASNRIISQLKTNSAGMAFGSSSPLPGSPIAILQKPTLAMRKQTPKRRYKLRSRVNSNQ